MMNILYVVWNLIRGGSEGQCAQMAMGFKLSVPKGRDIRFALSVESLNPDLVSGCRVAVFRKEGYYLDAVEETCGPVYHFDIRRTMTMNTLRQVRALADYIKREQISLLHAWDMDAVIYGCAAARLAGIPFITSRRDMGDIYPRYKLRLASFWDRRAAAVVVNARAIADKLTAGELPAEQIHCIDNLLDIESFDREAPSATLSKHAENRIRLICVARLYPEKDVDTLIKAFSFAVQKVSNLDMIIAGDGDEREALERLAAKCGVDDKLRFTGDVTDVPRRLRDADVGVLTPIRNEGLSNSIMEYMCARLPVIATDCGGNRELIDHGKGGFIAPAADAHAIADAIVRLAENPELRYTMGDYNRRRAEERFNPERVVKQYRELYESVLAQINYLNL